MSTKSEAYAAYLKDIYSEYDALAEGVVANSSFSLTAEEGGYEIVGSMPEGDIEALVFLVMMQAAKSAQEELKAIMEQIKAINQVKSRQRETLQSLKETLKARDDDKDDAERGTSGGDPCGVLDTDLAVELLIRVAAKQSDDDVQALADEVLALRERLRRAKKRDTPRDTLDSLSEMSDLMQLRLQMLLDRRAKLIETLSNILKKLSETQETIIENLK